MKKLLLLFLILMIVPVSQLYSQEPSLIYSYPIDGTEMHLPQTQILFKINNEIYPGLQPKDFNIDIFGSLSGIIEGNIKKLNSWGNFSCIPKTKFRDGEYVNVKISFRTENGVLRELKDFSFRIADSVVKQVNMEQRLFGDHDEYGTFKTPVNQTRLDEGGSFEMPRITITKKTYPAPGKIYLSPMANAYPDSNYLMIIGNEGKQYFTQKMPLRCLDFKKLPDGRLTYYDSEKMKYIMMDRDFNITEEVGCVAGHTADTHDMIVTPAGHYILMSYDQQYMDMSQVVPGGQRSAVVTGLVIQELDELHNLIFQWRSWDHFPVTSTLVSLTSGAIDYVHGNALELDYDGNLLFSSRHLSEITKLNLSTGEIMYRLGGKNSDIVILNDNVPFSFQHAIRRTKNNTYTLFDNGNQRKPPFYSRVVEYAINEEEKTATLIWQYRRSPDVFSLAMGYAERLDNGNTAISWGWANMTYTEVDPHGNTVLEFKLDPGIISYRVAKYPDDDYGQVTSPTAKQEEQFVSNYPNPFNPATKISIRLKSAGNVSLIVYDAMGREVRNLIEDKLMTAGDHEADFNASDLSSGIYFYTLRTGNEFTTRKMIYLK